MYIIIVKYITFNFKALSQNLRKD